MKRFSLCIVLLATACTAIVSSTSLYAANALTVTTGGVNGDAPEFCHDLDCPIYEIKDATDKWEKREYESVSPTVAVHLSRSCHEAVLEARDWLH